MFTNFLNSLMPLNNTLDLIAAFSAGREGKKKKERKSLKFFNLTHFLRFKKYFYCYSVAVVPNFTTLFSLLFPPPLPQSIPTLLSMGPLCVILDLAFPHLYSIIPLHSGYCQSVLYFPVSGSILLVCFVD